LVNVEVQKHLLGENRFADLAIRVEESSPDDKYDDVAIEVEKSAIGEVVARILVADI